MDALDRGYLMAVAGALVWSPRLLRSWLDTCGSARAILRLAQSADCRTPAGLDPIGAAALGRLRTIDEGSARRAINDLERSGARLVLDKDDEYPCALRDLVDPPPLLYVRGCLDSLRGRTVAIVGSRAATAYGRNVAASLATEFGSIGASIISGLARGIDASAHKAALNAGAPTVAIIGSGLSALYPSYHSLLADDIVAAGGAVISEFPPHFPPRAHQFPMRNRIVAALATATVVVEAGRRSGALITARLADELGRRVFAIPGDVGRPTSAGTNDLIKDGITLITDAFDAAELLGWTFSARAADETSTNENYADGTSTGETSKDGTYGEDGLLAFVSEAGVDVDELASLTGIDVGQLLARLTLLELRGVVARRPGGVFAAVKTPRPPNATAR